MAYGWPQSHQQVGFTSTQAVRWLSAVKKRISCYMQKGRCTLWDHGRMIVCTMGAFSRELSPFLFLSFLITRRSGLGRIRVRVRIAEAQQGAEASKSAPGVA